MLLAHALLRSMNHIAIRKHRELNRHRRPVFAYHVAFATMKGTVFIFNGLRGTMRRIEAVDQMKDEWEPFQEIEETRLIKRNIKWYDTNTRHILMQKMPRKARQKHKADIPVVIRDKQKRCSKCGKFSTIRIYIGKEWICQVCHSKEGDNSIKETIC